ncbi:ABC transporter ATP-binding protein [Paenibacillus aceti]|uniref:ABC transporter ATP-binding protein n=1 Tax=Paenibacillus aceti TaxID=1820010 RepID=A0ABQ1W4E5_9BACL|nr:ABC transporter ATP-binding protein [Paenibacillus aceti]GGG13291.1 ABC transporter ATP-binding protein [Paenibacillus aceti]
MSTVSLQQVFKNYELGKTSVPALRGIDLEIQEGDFVTMAGASGSGKSTLLNLIGCLDHPTTGEVWIGDTRVSKLDDKQLNETRLRQIGFVFQSFNLIPVLNVYENVELPLLIMKEISKKERKQRINYFLKAVGLSAFADRKPSELSGGQRQRVAVARALVTKPRIVLADEPTANLDSKTGIEIIDLMQQINEHEKTTFIFSTHDPKVMQRANRIFHLIDGKIEKVENIR